MCKRRDLERMAKNLSGEDQEFLLELLSSLQKEKDDSLKSLFISEHCKLSAKSCPHCASKLIVRFGTDKKGNQRYQCKECKKTFIASNNSLFFNSHKDLLVWEKYIDCFIKKLSLKATAEICGISVVTAFMWRHKILDALIEQAKTVKLKGNVEADETFFKLSFKGSRNLPNDRKPYRRGTPAKKNEIMSVSCAIDRGNNILSKLVCYGVIKSEHIRNLFDDHIVRGSWLCTDGLRTYASYVSYVEENCGNIKHCAVPADQKGGKRNINRINAYHSNLKMFMRAFKGVSTKYLNNYLAWFNILYKVKNESEKRKKVIATTLKSGFTEIWSNIKNRNPVPVLG